MRVVPNGPFRFRDRIEPGQGLRWRKTSYKGISDTPIWVIVFRCPNGHIMSLRYLSEDTPPHAKGHEIAQDGTVSRSVMCPADGCDFHDSIQLEGRVEP